MFLKQSKEILQEQHHLNVPQNEQQNEQNCKFVIYNVSVSVFRKTGGQNWINV